MRPPSAYPLTLLSLLGMAVASAFPSPLQAHTKGLYKTQAQAEERARQLGCQGTHQNNGLWMPCSDEAHLHQELRQK